MVQFLAHLLHSVHVCCMQASLRAPSSLLLHYLPNTVNTSTLPVDICHLKQTALIRSSTKCKYQSGRNEIPRKTHNMRQKKVCSTLLLARSRVFSPLSLFLSTTCKFVICVSYLKTRQLQLRTRLKKGLAI